MAEHTKKDIEATTEVASSSDNSEWNVKFEDDTGEKPFMELDGAGKMIRIATYLLKLGVILGALYVFVGCLSFLADAFRLVAGREAGKIFRDSELFNNPISGMLVGVLVTVLVQSSSTSTSIVITMVAADLLTVRQAISLIMGANIGTSVTSTIVAISASNNKNDFRRSFAAATVHDMFNFLNVAVLLPLEAASHYLEHFSKALVDGILDENPESSDKPPDLLKSLTKHFTKHISSVDKKVITKIAEASDDELAEVENLRMLKKFFGCEPKNGCDLSDQAAGWLLLFFSLILLCFCLWLVVRTLKSLLKGRIAIVLHDTVNGNFPDLKLGGLNVPMQWLSGYVAIVVGWLLTMAVQSSSITTSALTPLVGVGVISLERMYPVVVGANIGTCVTGLLAAFAADGSKLFYTLQVAFAHLIFNLTGTFIWYTIWPLRALPINAAKFLGNTTAEYKWFAVTYIFFAFFIIPGIFLGFSLAGDGVFITFVTLTLLALAFVTIVNVLQKRKPEWLPEKLKNWDFLPRWMRSLEPLDRLICLPLIAQLGKVFPCCKSKKAENVEMQQATIVKDDTNHVSSA